MQDKVIFEKKIGSKGGSLGITIPPELLRWIEAGEGDMLELAADVGKHGKYVTFWVKEAGE